MNKVKLSLVGLDGNAFSLMGAFSSAARKQGWKKADIDKVTADCMSGDYDHLLCVLMDNTIDPEDFEEEYDEDEEYDDPTIANK